MERRCCSGEFSPLLLEALVLFWFGVPFGEELEVERMETPNKKRTATTTSNCKVTRRSRSLILVSCDEECPLLWRKEDAEEEDAEETAG